MTVCTGHCHSHFLPLKPGFAPQPALLTASRASPPTRAWLSSAPNSATLSLSPSPRGHFCSPFPLWIYDPGLLTRPSFKPLDQVISAVKPQPFLLPRKVLPYWFPAWGVILRIKPGTGREGALQMAEDQTHAGQQSVPSAFTPIVSALAPLLHSQYSKCCAWTSSSVGCAGRRQASPRWVRT